MQVLLLSRDLMVVSHVEGAARRLDLTMSTASGAEQVVEECHAGFEGILLVDLSLANLDIATLLADLKMSEDNNLRVIAFGPHVHEAKLATAREAGCDLVVSRGELHGRVDEILRQ